MRTPKSKKHRHALENVAGMFKGFRPASQVLTDVRAVPTCLVQLDHAARVGGFPIERFSLVHGPSNEGKTALLLALIKSFLSRGHFVLFEDAERTTPKPWVRDMVGPLADSPCFFAEHPESYEKTIGRVREFLNTVAKLRMTGKVPPTTSALVLVDSLRKLVPEHLMKEILQEVEDEKKRRPGQRKKGITAGRDRGAQLKAKMNAAWMDELIPLLEHAQAAFVAIAREMVDPEAAGNPFHSGDSYKVGGGSAIYYDSSLVLRVERASWVQDAYKEGVKRNVYGERHRVTIKKTKVGGKDDKVAVCHFHTSNGVLVPAGFDRARDVLELGERFGVVKRPKKGWLTYGSHRWQGDNAAVKKLTLDSGLLDVVEREVRAKFEEHKPAEHTADGEVE